jgi:hypothetical protein
VESHLDPIDTWPSFIIEYLFIVTPTQDVITELAAFFSGNCVSMSSAYRLYRACNPTAKSNQHVRALFYARYFLWQNSSYILYGSRYYNVFLQEFVYLKDSYDTSFHPNHSVVPHI